MIRRQQDDNFLLITQHDHALLSGRLAERFGNARFAAPRPHGPTITGIALHDSGWPLHDDHPTLNSRGMPLHVFEAPPAITLPAWTASVDRAAEADEYAALLVSLHALSLSAITPSQQRSRQEMFLVNRFQQRQIELQEHLRRRLGLRTDIPLHHGLARSGADEPEDRLRFNFCLLQAMDRISLAICCSEHLFDQIDDLPQRVGHAPEPLWLHHPHGRELIVDPWPFNTSPLSFEIPCRRIPAMTFSNDTELQAVVSAAPVEALAVIVRPAGGTSR